MDMRPKVLAACLAGSLAVLAAVCWGEGGSSLPVLGPATGREVRVVGHHELKQTRGTTEDALRKQVLASFDDARVGEVRRLVNAPWSGEVARSLGKALLQEADIEKWESIRESRWHAVANLLAHAARNSTDEAMVQGARTTFDELFTAAHRIAVETYRMRVPLKQNLWFAVADAARVYGSSDLLTDSFWHGIEDGLWAPRVLETLGDEQVLGKLRQIRERNLWREESVQTRLLNRAIKLIELQLEYPEIRAVQNEETRLYLGRRLEAIKVDRVRRIEAFAKGRDDAKISQIIMAIAERLKKRGYPGGHQQE